MGRVSTFYPPIPSFKHIVAGAGRPSAGLRWLLTILSFAAILTGCSDWADNETLAAAGSPGKLTIYSGRSSSLVDPIIQQFGRASGIEIAVKYANTAQLAATLLEEGDKTPADLFFAQDPGGLGAVEHMLAPLDATILGPVPRRQMGRPVGASANGCVQYRNSDRSGPT